MISTKKRIAKLTEQVKRFWQAIKYVQDKTASKLKKQRFGVLNNVTNDV